jgi:hypothetical protein
MAVLRSSLPACGGQAHRSAQSCRHCFALFWLGAAHLIGQCALALHGVTAAHGRGARVRAARNLFTGSSAARALVGSTAARPATDTLGRGRRDTRWTEHAAAAAFTTFAAAAAASRHAAARRTGRACLRLTGTAARACCATARVATAARLRACGVGTSCTALAGAARALAFEAFTRRTGERRYTGQHGPRPATHR